MSSVEKNLSYDGYESLFFDYSDSNYLSERLYYYDEEENSDDLDVLLSNIWTVQSNIKVFKICSVAFIIRPSSLYPNSTGASGDNQSFILWK